MTAWPAELVQSAATIAATTKPIYVPTAGEGAPGEHEINEDFVAVTTAAEYGVYILGPYLKSSVKIKRVVLYTKGIDTNSTATATLDVNLQFSERSIGGNPVINNTTLQDVQDGTQPLSAGGIPTSAFNGTLLADPLTESAYTGGSPNKLFGTTAVANSGAVQVKDITFANSAFTFAMTQQPLWEIFGFTNNAGVPADPGGYFQFFVVISAAVATAGAGVIGIQVEYVE